MNILVTGGASGLGRAITKKLVADGINTVFFTYKSSQTSALEIENNFPNAKSIKLDFSSTQSVTDFCNTIPDLKLDVLINNAISGFTQNHFHKTDIDVFNNSFLLNVSPVLKITQQFIKEARKRKKGRIITILTSGLINKPSIGWSEYVANKAYLFSMTKSWAVENANFGITSNSISPSFMATNLTSEIDSRLVEGMINSNPNRSLLKEEEVADAVAFFVYATSHLNGSNLVINAASDLV